MASGKTTLINKIAELDSRYQVLMEEIKIDEINDFYNSGMANAVESELRVFFNELYQYRRNKDPDKIYLFDRTYMDTYVFTQALHKYGKVSNIEKSFFNEIYHTLTDDLISPFDYYIYLNTDVDYLYNNMIRRDRKSEHVVDKKYLETLNWSFRQTWDYLKDRYLKSSMSGVEYLGGKFIYLRHVTMSNEEHYNRVINNLHLEFTENKSGNAWYIEI